MTAHLVAAKHIGLLALSLSVCLLCPLSVPPVKADEPSPLEVKAAELVVEKALKNTFENGRWPNGKIFKQEIKNLQKISETTSNRDQMSLLPELIGRKTNK